MSKPYPCYYTVNDRPVKLVELPEGRCDALVFEWETGNLAPDRSYFERVSETGIGKDVDRLTEEEFERRVAGLRASLSTQRQATPITWAGTGDGEFPYRIEIRGHVFTIRVNDFPAEPLYTLLIDDREVENLEDWPPAWIRPV